MNEKMIELLILFAIAAFVLFRLKSVIGTRTGFEAPPEKLRGGAGAGAASAKRPGPADAAEEETGLDRPLPAGAAETLAAIREAEPDFSLPRFLDGARGAYEMILMAYESGDRDTLKGLLSPEVYAAFEQVVSQREAQGLHVDARFVGVRDLRLESVSYDPADGEADISLRFVGEMITAVCDSENRVVEGDPNEVRRQTDVWTFSRRLGARDPNWLLSATGE
ncbi:MAG TPA: Tim44/TimA family putative adaptor protein [Thermohalobaculum sp.]|nr:Tim44/TimA family putative adaptor protein [Thermohalobaculum sp.]